MRFLQFDRGTSGRAEQSPGTYPLKSVSKWFLHNTRRRCAANVFLFAGYKVCVKRLLAVAVMDFMIAGYITTADESQSIRPMISLENLDCAMIRRMRTRTSESLAGGNQGRHLSKTPCLCGDVSRPSVQSFWRWMDS